jgi:hypothetical protein
MMGKTEFSSSATEDFVNSILKRNAVLPEAPSAKCCNKDSRTRDFYASFKRPVCKCTCGASWKRVGMSSPRVSSADANSKQRRYNSLLIIISERI